MNDQNTPTSPLEYLEKQVTALKVIATVLVALVIGAFSAGIFWNNLLGYEQKINKLQDDLTTLTKNLDQFKMNIGQLGDPSYETEVTNDHGSPGVPGVRVAKGAMWSLAPDTTATARDCGFNVLL
jgi:hypothetical protein